MPSSIGPSRCRKCQQQQLGCLQRSLHPSIHCQSSSPYRHPWRLSWSRKYDRQLPRRQLLGIHPSQSCQSPNGQQCLRPSNQRPTVQPHSEHTATNRAISTTNGDIGQLPTNANDAKSHAYTQLQHATHSSPGANGTTTPHATQHTGVHTLPSTHATKQPYKRNAR